MAVEQPNPETVAHDKTGAEKAAERAAAGQQSEHEKAEAEATREERVSALIAGYRHALEHNSPRTTAELAEIEALLGVVGDPLPAEADADILAKA